MAIACGCINKNLATLNVEEMVICILKVIANCFILFGVMYIHVHKKYISTDTDRAPDSLLRIFLKFGSW